VLFVLGELSGSRIWYGLVKFRSRGSFLEQWRPVDDQGDAQRGVPTSSGCASRNRFSSAETSHCHGNESNSIDGFGTAVSARHARGGGTRFHRLETRVDADRFRGTCYRAANWIYVGQTTGRGRWIGSPRLSVRSSKTFTSIRCSPMQDSGYAGIPPGKSIHLGFEFFRCEFFG
jgi:hypothetical protein